MQIQETIIRYADGLFGSQKYLEFEDFVRITKKRSSDLFFMVMAILHERLPCGNNLFRLKKSVTLGKKLDYVS